MGQTRLKRDLDNVMTQVHTLLDTIQSDASADNLPGRVKQAFGSAQTKVVQLADEAKTRTKVAAKATDQYVHERPWQAIGLGAVAGLIVGLLASNSRR